MFHVGVTFSFFVSFVLLVIVHCTIFVLLVIVHCTIFVLLVIVHCTIFVLLVIVHCTIFVLLVIVLFFRETFVELGGLNLLVDICGWCAMT